MNKQVLWSIIGAVVLTVVLGAVALTTLKPATQADSSDQGASNAAQQTATPARPDCPAGPIAGVDLDCLGGGTGPANAAEGIWIVNIWAAWCLPCRDELPHLQQVAIEHPEWNVVGVHADVNATAGAELLNELGVDLPSFQDPDGRFAATLGLPGVIPITVIVRDGNVVGRYIQPFESADDIVAAVEESV